MIAEEGRLEDVDAGVVVLELLVTDDELPVKPPAMHPVIAKARQPSSPINRVNLRSMYGCYSTRGARMCSASTTPSDLTTTASPYQ